MNNYNVLRSYISFFARVRGVLIPSMPPKSSCEKKKLPFGVYQPTGSDNLFGRLSLTIFLQFAGLSF